MKKKLVAMIMAAAMVFSTAAATAAIADEAENLSPAPQKLEMPINIAIVTATMNTYYSLVVNGAKEQLERWGGDAVGTIDVYSPTSDAKMVEEQIGFLETLLQDPDLDALCFSTHNDTEFIPYLRQFAEKGIPVYLFNMPAQDVSNQYYESLIAYDFYEAGRLSGEWVKENLADQDVKMLYIEGIEGTHNTVRTAGFMDGIEGADNIEIVVSQCGQWTREGGQTVTENALQSNPEINCVFGPYDEMPLGAIVALKDAGRIDDVTVVGYDCTEDGLAAIKAGTMAASVNTDAKLMGNNMIDTIVAHDLEGKEVDRAVMNELVVIDSTNCDTVPEDNYTYTEREQEFTVEQ